MQFLMLATGYQDPTPAYFQIESSTPKRVEMEAVDRCRGTYIPKFFSWLIF